MKKLIMLAFVLIGLTGCGSDDDDPNLPPNPSSEELAVMAKMNGYYIGSSYSSITNTTEYEELNFSPLTSPRIELVIVLNGLDLEWQNSWIFGTVLYSKYFDDHLLEISKNCYYSISCRGSEVILNLYPYGDNGRVNNHAEQFILSSVSQNSFEMRPYGLEYGGLGTKRMIHQQPLK